MLKEPHHVDPSNGAVSFGEVVFNRVVCLEGDQPLGSEDDSILEHQLHVRGDGEPGSFHQSAGIGSHPAIKIAFCHLAGFYRHIPPSDRVTVFRFDGNFRVDKQPGCCGNHRHIPRLIGGLPGPLAPHCPCRLQSFRVDRYFAGGALGDDAGGSSRPHRTHYPIGGTLLVATLTLALGRVEATQQGKPDGQKIGLVFSLDGSERIVQLRLRPSAGRHQ